MRRFSARETTSSYKAAVSRALAIVFIVLIAGSTGTKTMLTMPEGGAGPGELVGGVDMDDECTVKT